MLPDTRTLSTEAQEALRQRVIAARKKGISISEASRLFHVTRQSIYNWESRLDAEGQVGLLSKPRGKPPEHRLKGHQAAAIIRILVDKHPDQMKFPFALWTREAVQDVIQRKFGIELSLSTVGRYLKRWGFSPQKPVFKAYEQQPEAVRQWIKLEFPALKARALREKAEIFWEDETGIRSDHHAGRSWGLKGQTPVILSTGKRFRFNMIAALSNRGSLVFSIVKKGLSARTFLLFLMRLIKGRRRKVILIVDGHPAHRAKKVKDWVAANESKLELVFLPAYSPELNPVELLNQDVKTNAVGRRRIDTADEMQWNVRNYMQRRRKYPEMVRRYFHHRHVRYAL